MKNRITVTTKSVTIENLEGAEALVNIRKGDTVTEETVFPNAVKTFAFGKDVEITVTDNAFVESEVTTEKGEENE